MSTRSTVIKARLAREHREPLPDAAKISELRQQYKAQRLAEHIERTLAEAPPLTAEQRAGLAELFRPARELAKRKAVGKSRADIVADRLAELDGGDAA